MKQTETKKCHVLLSSNKYSLIKQCFLLPTLITHTHTHNTHITPITPPRQCQKQQPNKKFCNYIHFVVKQTNKQRNEKKESENKFCGPFIIINHQEK